MKSQINLFIIPGRKINVVSKDEKTGTTQRFSFKHTDHSQLRASQRGISPQKLALVLEYGDTFSKQGLLFCVLGEDRIPEKFHKQKDKYKNTVVVLDETTSSIITCYRARHPYRQIKKKSKRLAVGQWD